MLKNLKTIYIIQIFITNKLLTQVLQIMNKVQ